MSARAALSLAQGVENERRSISAASCSMPGRSRRSRIGALRRVGRLLLGAAIGEVAGEQCESVDDMESGVEERRGTAFGNSAPVRTTRAPVAAASSIQPIDVGGVRLHVVVEQHQVRDVVVVRPATQTGPCGTCGRQTAHRSEGTRMRARRRRHDRRRRSDHDTAMALLALAPWFPNVCRPCWPSWPRSPNDSARPATGCTWSAAPFATSSSAPGATTSTST